MDCKYCSEDFDSEPEYLEHLSSVHTREEVSTIDERKVDEEVGGFSDDSRELPADKIYLGIGVILFAAFVGFVGYTIVSGVGNSSQTYDWVETSPTAVGTVHYHGEMYVTIDGNSLDFSRDKFQLNDDAFHFEAGEGVRWHGHAQQLTLQYALATLNIKATQNKLTYNGTTYTTQEYAITYEVNGEQVQVADYKLKQGDVVRVTVTEK